MSGREPVRTPMRPASGFSSFTPDTKKASWEELARERDDGETKNYSVPPELIELARANRKARGQVGTLTPLAPKPVRDVVVVVPSAPPVAADLRAAELDSENVLQAPSVPIPLGQANSDPDSARTVVAGAGYASARPSEPPSSATPASTATSPLAEIMRSELAVARGATEPCEGECGEVDLPKAQPDVTNASEAELANMVESTGVRRTSRRAPRSLRIEMPSEVSAAARAASADTVKRRNYVPVALGACIVGAYIVLCYYANVMLAGVP